MNERASIVQDSLVPVPGKKAGNAYEEGKIMKADIVHADWRKAVGEFVAKKLEKRGDKAEDVVAYVTCPLLADAKKWKQVIAGDKTMSPTIFRNALAEVFKLYNEPESASVEAQQLIMEYPEVLRKHAVALRPDSEAFGGLPNFPIYHGNAPVG